MNPQPRDQLQRRLSVTRVVLIALLCTVQFRQLAANMHESLNAYIPATHKRMFEMFNSLILGDLSVTKAAFRGALGVQGKAELAGFSIADDIQCNREVRALVVGGALTARMGSINNGYTVVGRRSNLHHSVKMECSNRVERYDPRRGGDVDFNLERVQLIRETADLCASPATGTTRLDNTTMHFDPGEKDFSCYTFFKISTSDLRLVDRWTYNGTDYYRNIVIVVAGLRHDFRNFLMTGFNPRRTLIVFCSIYGSFGFYGAKVLGSILGPTATFTTMEAIVNGSIIAGGLSGSIATLNVPYVTC